MDTLINTVLGSANKFMRTAESSFSHRFLSWQHCYKVFANARKKDEKTDVDTNFLSLHLAFYLASWGMYRGSSFLLQKDYTVHKPIVQEILKPEYDVLLGLSCKNLLENTSTQNSLRKLYKELGKLYGEIREDVNRNKDIMQLVSYTLITKVLLGTLGCVPAYDRFFKKAVKKNKVTTAKYSIDSILKLAKFYEDNSTKFNEAQKTLIFDDIEYPQMKFLDMAFWQMGFDLDSEMKSNKSKS